MSAGAKPPPPASAETLMTADQIAAALGVTTRQVRLMLSAGKFPPCDVKIGRLSRWKVSSYNDWINDQARCKE